MGPCSLVGIKVVRRNARLIVACEEWGRPVDLRSKRKQLQGLNGAVGLAAGLGGYVGNLYTPGMATFLMLSIWIVGATLINLLTDPPDKK